jgi:hypothetical protein
MSCNYTGRRGSEQKHNGAVFMRPLQIIDTYLTIEGGITPRDRSSNAKHQDSLIVS